MTNYKKTLIILFFFKIHSIFASALERWQSGRSRRSWKPLNRKVPGVRIPHFPPGRETGCKSSLQPVLFLASNYAFAASSPARRCGRWKRLQEHGCTLGDSGVHRPEWSCFVCTNHRPEVVSAVLGPMGEEIAGPVSDTLRHDLLLKLNILL